MTLRYVALGDSYTIGTSVGEAERWPNQLVVRLRSAFDDSGRPAASAPLELVANLAVNGYTSADVIARELPALEGLAPGFVSLLVGVNDVVQGVPPERYRRQVNELLETLSARLGPRRIVTIATPDYTVTPAGADYGDPDRRSAEIRAANALFERLATDRGIRFVDIHDVSLAARDDRTLVAPDGLHPSGSQYARWVDRIEPVVRDLLADVRSG